MYTLSTSIIKNIEVYCPLLILSLHLKLAVLQKMHSHHITYSTFLLWPYFIMDLIFLFISPVQTSHRIYYNGSIKNVD